MPQNVYHCMSILNLGEYAPTAHKWEFASTTSVQPHALPTPPPHTHLFENLDPALQF